MSQYFQSMNLSQSICHSLQRKYEDSFSFFRAKDINQLVYGFGTRQVIFYDDLMILDQKSEYMRRMYQCKTMSGKNEIQQRIQMVGKFYVEYNMLTYEVPFMFVTDTKDMWLRRQKKMKQLRRQQEQYDGGQQQKQQNKDVVDMDVVVMDVVVMDVVDMDVVDMNINGQKQQQKIDKDRDRDNFLQQLQLNMSQLMIDYSSYLDIEEQLMDEEIYDIYSTKQGEQKQLQKQNTQNRQKQQKQQQQQQNQYQKYRLQLNNPKQYQQLSKYQSLPLPLFSFNQSLTNNSSIDHLVCDFMQIDIDQAIEFYRQFIKTKNGSTLMSELLQQEIKLSHKNSQKQSINNNNNYNYKDNYSNNYINNQQLYQSNNQNHLPIHLDINMKNNYSTNNTNNNNQTILQKYRKQNTNKINFHKINNNNNNVSNSNTNNINQIHIRKIPPKTIIIKNNYASTPHPSPNNKPKQMPNSKPKLQHTQLSSTLIDKYLQKYKYTTTTTKNNVQNQQQQDHLIIIKQQQQKQQRNKIRQKAQKLLQKIKTESSSIHSIT